MIRGTQRLSREHTNSHKGLLSSTAYLYLHSCQLSGNFAVTADISLQADSKADKNNTQY